MSSLSQAAIITRPLEGGGRTMREVACAFCGGRGKDPFGIMSWLSTCCVCGGTGVVQVGAGSAAAGCSSPWVEDTPANALAGLECGHVSFLMTGRGKPDIPDPRIRRVDSWGEIEETLSRDLCLVRSCEEEFSAVVAP